MRKNDKLKDVFANGLMPPNSNIDKTIPGNGITTAELKAKRHSIIINPQVNTIIQKHEYCLKEKINGFAIYDKSEGNLKEFLTSQTKYKKILITPESFLGLIYQAEDLGLLKHLKDDFFCFVDESHCFASESFREKILAPIDEIFGFTNKAFASATPFLYTDPRFNELQKYKMVYEGDAGIIKLISCTHPISTLYQVIKQKKIKGNVHIFLNSVTQIGKFIRDNNLTDVSIFCANKQENKTKLAELWKYFKPTITGDYKKYNFYTCRYIEGFDLIDDEKTTIIIVTDIKVPHSLISIPIKAVQAIGRLREVTPSEIYHITNNYGLPTEIHKTLEQISKPTMFLANKLAKNYNDNRTDLIHAGLTDYRLLDDVLYPVIRKVNGIACVHHFKVNQRIYNEWVIGNYHNLEIIISYWKEARFVVEPYEWNFPQIEIKNRPSIDINKSVIELIVKNTTNPELYKYGEADEVINALKTKYAVLFNAITHLGIQKIQELNYNNKSMKEELIKKSNHLAMGKIMQSLSTTLVVKTKYSRKYLKSLLQKLYNDFQFLGKDGKIKKANAEDLKNLNLYNTSKARMPTVDGIRNSGFIITECLFKLQAA